MKSINLTGQVRHAELAFAGLSDSASKHMAKLANATRNEALRLIYHSTPTGRKYPRGRKEHVASRPGEPPAVDTGTLGSNIFADRLGRNAVAGVPNRPRTAGGIVGNANRRMAYAAILEYRKRRKWLRPAGERALAKTKYDLSGFTLRLK